MRVRVLAFARLRELLSEASHEVTLPEGASAADLWDELVTRCADLAEWSQSTRIARNGRIVTPQEPLADRDEIALLPPVGGG